MDELLGKVGKSGGWLRRGRVLCYVPDFNLDVSEFSGDVLECLRARELAGVQRRSSFVKFGFQLTNFDSPLTKLLLVLLQQRLQLKYMSRLKNRYSLDLLSSSLHFASTPATDSSNCCTILFIISFCSPRLLPPPLPKLRSFPSPPAVSSPLSFLENIDFLLLRLRLRL